MSDLAELEVRLRRDHAFGDLAQTYLHRAVREDALGFTIGRDAILADWTTQARAEITIQADLGDMIAYQVGTGKAVWFGHRWVKREGDKIAHETLIENRGVMKIAPPSHAPLGELRAGRGQFDAGDTPILPVGFPVAAGPLATLLHKAWNGRAFDLYEAPWLVSLIKALPDATFYFERSIVAGDAIAILWRVHGHHRDGQRVRLIGSSVMTFIDGQITSDRTNIDFDALSAQLDRDIIS